MAYNTCSPARIYGPLPQTILCGCSILSFSASTGWNEQASGLTIELVKDTCVGPRVWWDENLKRQQGDIADPGFTYPEPGCAIYFRIEENSDATTEAERGGFEYSGLVESWNERYDSNGNPVYSLKITDPRIILENTQVIVNNYPGTTSQVWNLINAYGYVESLGFPCTSSEAGGIGGTTSANTIGNIANERGMAWNDLKCALHTLLSTQDQTIVNQSYQQYCADSRLVYIGPTLEQQGYGVIKRDGIITGSGFLSLSNANLNKSYYTIDLTELPFSPNHYRISGPNISLMEIISQVCADAGCDYYIELLPVKVGNKIHKIIKVRVAIRRSQPQLGKLDEFIAAKQEQNDGQVLSYTKGEEVRNEETTAFLLGGNRKDSFELTANEMLPFWGLDTDGNLIQATITDNEYYVRLDFYRLNETLFNPLSRYGWVSESELRAAIGDIDSWKAVTIAKGGDLAAWCDAENVDNMINLSILRETAAGVKPAIRTALPPTQVDITDGAIDSEVAKDIDKIYEYIRSYANEYYGKKFLANCTSFLCYALDTENNKYRYSHTPSTDGCWVLDNVTTVLGLTHQSTASDFFRDESGKYQAIARFPLTAGFTLGGGGGSIVADPSRLGEGDYITNGANYIWVKADIDPDWVKGTPLSPSSDIYSCILTISSAVTNRTSGDFEFINAMNGINILLDIQNEGQAIPPGKPGPVDRGTFVLSALPVAISPDAVLVPVTNHVDTYGPWGVAGLPGQVSLEIDEGFVPWEYGSDQIMNNAAADKVANAVTQMRKGERGSISIAGFPNIPLGAELFSVDTTNPPESQGLQKYFGSRTASYSSCSTLSHFIYCKMNAWTGEFGPNVTSVNVSIGSNGFTTEYQFSTYTPQFGRFNKDNAERLKRLGQNRLQMNRNMRSKFSILNRTKNNLNRAMDFIENQVARSSRSPKSAHHMLIARYNESGGIEINTQSSKDAVYAFTTDAAYPKCAMGSWDTLFRPVSKAGDGGFSKYVTASISCIDAKDNSEQNDPPINEYSRLEVSVNYLDPYANPNDTVLSRSDSPTSGHDMEALGRGSTLPSSGGWSVQQGESVGQDGYTDDYRFLALRGPIIIQQWGYDLHGKPVPNAADTEAAATGGAFVSSNLKDKFLDSWLQKPKTWPVAPLDLRLDRERGVWVTPQPPRPVHVTTENCLLDNTTCTPTNLKAVYDAAGNAIATKTVDVTWPWTINPPDNPGKFPAYYDTADCMYYAFPINRLDVNDNLDIKKLVFDTTDPGCGGLYFDVQITNADSCDATATISLLGDAGINVVGNNSCSDVFVSSFKAETITFGAGLSVADNGCAATVTADINIGKATTGCEAGGFGGPGEVLLPYAPFQYLDIGEGLRLTGSSCTYKIEGGIKVSSDNCNAFEPAFSDDWYTKITVGSGLSVEAGADGCSAILTSPLVVGSYGEDGQSMTLNADCTPVEPGTTFVCEDDCGHTFDLSGPHCIRKPPRYLGEIWAGRGIGITSCDSCRLIIFNNHIDDGAGPDCSSVRGVQIAKHEWGGDFAISAGSDAGAGCDGAQYSLTSKIELSAGGGWWESSFVKSINVETGVGGFVTSVTANCCSFGGVKTCGALPKYLITYGIEGCACSSSPGGGGGLDPPGTTFDASFDNSMTGAFTSETGSLQLPLVSGESYDFIALWGDGTYTTITGYNDSGTLHTYPGTGVFTLNVMDTTDLVIRFNNSGDAPKLVEISRWGDSTTISYDSTFYGCTNLQITTNNIPLIATTDLSNTFRDCSSLQSGLSYWNTSGVTNMSYMLANAAGYDEDISQWNVESVTGLVGFMSGVTLSVENYDALLSGWSAQVVQTGVYADFGNSQYSTTGEPYLDILTGTYNWNISDNGPATTGAPPPPP